MPTTIREHSRAAARGPANAHAAQHAPARLEVDPDWSALAPRGIYADRVRPALDYGLLALVALPALAIGLAVALANAVAFRSLRQVLFVQPRLGLRGRTFQLVKFRTMRETPGSHFAAWSDGDRARVTRFGRFLRNAHLDELPQLLNVARGEMSFIGPRPEMLEVEAWAGEHVPGFSKRLAIKPGITGLAQVTQGYTGRDPGAYARKLEINLSYLRSMSLALDLAILARTFLWMARGKGWSWNARADGRAAGD